ncbi:pirin family protein [Duganella sp. BJB1802]|uniref:pirin family protein n=1 Tax=Duganella sp. BJB1802 TaxID=2744575 RepID=UPI0035A3D3C0
MMPVIATVQRANHGSHFRAFGLRGVSELINPFIGIDHAWMSAPTFPAHPHTGFSAVSYLFLDSETGIENQDSVGNHNLIKPGGLHWMAAGRGVIHEEVPAEVGKTVHSLQIFVGLAAADRGREPYALGIEPQDVPVVHLPGARVRVPVGTFGAVSSPLKPPAEVIMLDIGLEAEAELVVPVAAGYAALVMPIFGTVAVDGQHFDRDDL